MALFSEDLKRMASAYAVEDCQLIAIMSFSVQQITRDHPELMYKIKGIIEERMLDNKISDTILDIKKD